MPTYDFRCPNGHDFEKFYRKISDGATELPCPTCGEVAQRRVSGGAGLLFKGSGFYLTDYGKDAHRKPAPSGTGKDDGAGAAAKRETPSEPKGESSTGQSAAKGESKPAESKPGQSKSGSSSTGNNGE